MKSEFLRKSRRVISDRLKVYEVQESHLLLKERTLHIQKMQDQIHSLQRLMRISMQELLLLKRLMLIARVLEDSLSI